MKLDFLFSSFPFISSDRVTISRINDTDIQALWEIMSDDANYRFSPTAALSDFAEMRAKLTQIKSEFRDRRSLVLGIYSSDHLNKLIGFFEMSDLNPSTECVTISITLDQHFVGKGYARDTLSSAVKYLFGIVRVNRIQTYSMPGNYRYSRLLDRGGFTKEGTIREGFYWPDKGLVDLDLFSMLSSDYMRSQHLTEARKHFKF